MWAHQIDFHRIKKNKMELLVVKLFHQRDNATQRWIVHSCVKLCIIFFPVVNPHAWFSFQLYHLNMHVASLLFLMNFFRSKDWWDSIEKIIGYFYICMCHVQFKTVFEFFFPIKMIKRANFDKLFRQFNIKK